MKNIFGLILIIVLSSNTFNVCQEFDNENYVPNEETAIKIAKAVWLPIYGKSIYKKKPFEAELKKDSIWLVKGTLHQPLGGVPLIKIRKSDCKILEVSHGK